VLTGMLAAPSGVFKDGEAVVQLSVTAEQPAFKREKKYRLMGPASRHHAAKKEETP
jgi:hypothetical protein